MAVILLPIIAVGGLFVVWAGMKGSYNRIEATCEGDSVDRPGYGAYSGSAEVWPPTVVCEANGNDVPTVFESHPFTAWFLFGATIVVPVWYVVSVVVGLWWFLLRARRPRPWISADVVPVSPSRRRSVDDASARL